MLSARRLATHGGTPPPALVCLASQALPAPEWGTNSPLGGKTLLQEGLELPVRGGSCQD